MHLGRVYGILGRGNAARVDAYEPVSALASCPRPEMGMAPRHTSHGWSFLRAGVPLEQMSRCFVVTTDVSKTV